QYDPRSNRFHTSSYYRNLLGDQSIRYLKEDKEGNIWFIHEKSLGVLNIGTPDTSILMIPELNNKLNSGFEFIYPIDRNNVFVGAEKGFFHINYEKYRMNKPRFSVQLSKVQISGPRDSLLFGGYFSDVNLIQLQPESMATEVSNKWRTIRFEFSSALFSQQSNMEYSFILKGFDNEWSPWSTRTEKEYTRLPHGSYRFEVKARNKPGNESDVLTYRFRILPPWHRTKAAFLAYILLILCGIYVFYRWQQRKFARQQFRYEQEQKKLQYLHQLEIDKAEAELVALRNEKLQAEIEFQNAELANSTMHLLQKGEMLAKLRSDLQHVMKEANNEKVSEELKKLIRALSVDDKMENDWDNFAKHFDKVQRDFVSTLKQQHPSITPNELKLCAYLRMNLSTKEIAQLMNISVRGVEISRYRLRKKLGLETGASLYDYLIKL
ncbi:MAG: triple tyrosine motif-containing protein, partial [Chitinophagaceae bacterium]